MGKLVTLKAKSADRYALEAAVRRLREAFTVEKDSGVLGDGSGYWAFLEYVEEAS